MRKINFDELINLPIDVVLSEFDKNNIQVEIACEDGSLICHGGEIVYSYYYWDFLRTYPKLPRLTRYIFKNTQYTDKSHLNFVRVFFKDIYEYYNYGEINSEYVIPSKNLVTVEDLGELSCRVTERVYSLMVNVTMAYTTTFSAIDIVQVIFHPEIKAANDKLQEIEDSGQTVSPHHISECYAKIQKELFTNHKFDNNAFVAAVRTGQANIGQVMQFVGPVGYRTDVESSIFSKPIITSYAMGIRKPADKAKDSRSASKSEYMNAELLGKTEYRNRELQIVGLLLGNINMEDCGSTDYLTIFIPRYTEEDKRSCFDFVGLYYLDEEENRLKRIRKEDAIGLGGKRIKVRSPITCKNPDPHHICRFCMGDTSTNISANDSIHQHCETTVTGPIEQSVISNKHHDASSTITPFVPPTRDLNFIRVNNDELSIYLADRLANRNVRLHIRQKECPNIADIDRVDNIRELNISQTSSLTNIIFEITYKNGMSEEESISVSPRGRPSSLSYALLKYMKTYGWKIEEKNYITVSLDNWDINKPLFTLPLQHRNKTVFFNDVITNIKTYGRRHEENLKNGMNFNESIVELLMGTYYLVCEEFHFNFALYEVILKAYLIVDSKEGDIFTNLSLPRPGIDKPSVGDFNVIAGLRSVSARMSWEKHGAMIKDIPLYIKENKPDHPMDSIFTDKYMDMGDS
jgi:hypothetical protein